MTYSQTQIQPISLQLRVSNFEHFGAGSARIFFLPLGMPHCSGLILQLSSEEMTLSENARNVLMDMKEEEEEEAILVAAKDTKW